MSHFTTVVLVEPELTSEEAIHERISELLAPFDEHMEVDEYDRPCGCVGWIAKTAAREAAEAAYPLDTLRAQLFAEFPTDEPFADNPPREARWAELLTPRDAVEAATLAARDDATAPDPACEKCHGGGTYRSQYNPKSKWDWWRIGGRWYGVLTGQPQQSDDGFNFSLMDAAEKDLPRLIRENSGLVRELDPAVVVKSTYALVTPDGAWHAKATMGWFGMSHGKAEDWDKRLPQVLSEFPRYRAVLCDLHI